jgi:Gpi18-like mannosyltransferase
MTTVDHEHGDVLERGDALQRRNALARLALALVLFKAFLLLLAWSTTTFFPDLFQQRNYFGNFHWPPDRPPDQSDTLATWDAQHYLFLGTEGYHAGQQSIAFFPLYPWLIRVVAALPGIGPLTASLLLANGLSLAGLLLLHRFLASRHPGSADDTLLLTLAFPGALFFCFPYTESLFLLLAVATIVALARDRWLLAALPAFAIALTRPNGVLIGVAILYAAAAAWRRDRELSWQPLVALAAPALGFLAYLLFMRAATGSAFAGFAMQDAYNAKRSLGNFLHPLFVLHELVDVRTLHGVLYSLLDRLAFVFVMVALVPLWRMDRLLFWYALPMALVGPLSGSFVSYTRFACVLFPCQLVAARGLEGERRRPFLWLVLAAWFAIQIVLLVRHASFRWAG